MPDPLEPSSSESPIVPPGAPARRRAWRLSLLLAFVMLGALAWLLARLVWLPMFFGLFFFLVAGLLVSAITFRIARCARPLTSGAIARGAIVVSLLTAVVTLFWEYEHFSDTVGDPPRFIDARNAAVLAGRASREVQVRASEEFKSAIRSQYLPEGVIHSRYLPLGAIVYVVWTVRAGEMKLSVEGETDTIFSSHRGVIWPLRTLAATALLAAGLWLGFESLRSSTPTTNVLAPGEEAVEEA